MEDELLRLRTLGKRTYAILSNPEAPLLDPRRSLFRFSGVLQSNPIAENLAHVDEAGMTNRQFKRLAALTAVQLIDPVPFLCRDAICPNAEVRGDGRLWPIYMGANHLAAWWVREHATYIDQIYDLADNSSRP